MRGRNGEGNVTQESVGVMQMLPDSFVMTMAYQCLFSCKIKLCYRVRTCSGYGDHRYAFNLILIQEMAG
jgi:hypothetical protein